MNKFNVWQSVKVSEKGHELEGQAGTVQANVKEGAETVPVKFDIDGATVPVSVDSVQVLS